MPIRLKKEQIEVLESQGLITSKPKSVKKARPVKKINPELFKAMAKANGLPEPIPEYQFCNDRKWRFDWLFRNPMPGAMTGIHDSYVAVEIVGGVWSRGHHSRGQGQIDDMEKRNMAQIMAYKVLEFTPQQIESGEAFSVINMALYGKKS